MRNLYTLESTILISCDIDSFKDRKIRVLNSIDTNEPQSYEWLEGKLFYIAVVLGPIMKYTLNQFWWLSCPFQILNLLLRLAWLQSITHLKFGTRDNIVMDSLFASLEILRRGHWNFYRCFFLWWLLDILMLVLIITHSHRDCMLGIQDCVKYTIYSGGTCLSVTPRSSRQIECLVQTYKWASLVLSTEVIKSSISLTI